MLLLLPNLDNAVIDVVTVSAEVIWGQSGRDVDAEGFKTKMPEVNGAAKAAYHSFELISSLISLPPDDLGRDGYDIYDSVV
jgi:U3 small nucleolar RNA-associated protein 20